MIPEDPQTMPEEPDAVDIERSDDGTIVVTFGARVTAADITAAFATLPSDAWVADIGTTWFNEAEDCQGQDFEDEEHTWPVISVFMEPAVLAAEVDS